MKLSDFASMVNGKVWKKGDKVRIYFQTDRTVSAFLDYEAGSGDEVGSGCEGAKLCVFSKCEKQSRAWNLNRAKQIKFEIMQRISAVTGDKICDTWQEVIL